MAGLLPRSTYSQSRRLFSLARSLAAAAAGSKGGHPALPQTNAAAVGGRRQSVRLKSRKSKDTDSLSDIIQPLSPAIVKGTDDIDVGEELVGSLKKEKLLQVLSQFQSTSNVRTLAFENGMDARLFAKSFMSFRKFCIESEQLPVDLHVVLSDILQGSGNIHDIFPYFLRHSFEIFPHLECMEDLKKISDLRLPANWYPDARSIQRRFIFHAGPTNSGKTHHALERFLQAESGLYCGPLKLLASEVYSKSNASGTPCDLVTGEERRFSREDGEPCSHVASTVEMASLNNRYEVAVIDEIQMIADGQRGWAWTRAVLGLYADEIHVCGEASAIDLIKEMALTTGDEVEVRRYKRLTDLTYLDTAVERFENVRRGDCIVCFNKNDIYFVTKQLEQLNKECAVIYGSLPPSTKLAQAQKFNDPDNPCKVLVATDAIGMGLNLAIKRVIFYSVTKPMLNENGDIEMDLISTSQALQIGGRAGRYNTAFAHGQVTTFRTKDLRLLKEILNQPIDTIMQGGLHPTADQIELFAYHLPKATLSNLIEIFEKSCELDQDTFFMCKNEDFKFLADMIEHVPMPLRARYTFCCAPIPVKQPFACVMFLKFARRFSRSDPLTLSWLCAQIGWPVKVPENLIHLVHLESVFDILDLYLWLSYRFPDLFPDAAAVREIQSELDVVIQEGVRNLVQLVRNQEESNSGGGARGGAGEFGYQEEADFVRKTKIQRGMGKGTQRPLQLAQEKLAQKEKRDRHSKRQASSQLAKRLVESGVLSRDVLDKLKREWEQEAQRLDQHTHHNGDHNDENTDLLTTDDDDDEENTR